MIGSIRIGKISGISIEIHATFLLTILWAAWQGARAFGSLVGALYGCLSILLLFGCVFLHELGHSLQARAFGIGVRRITLLPIGGLARLEASRYAPSREFFITLAGPAVNLVLAAITVLAVAFTNPDPVLYAIRVWSPLARPSLNSSLVLLLLANLSLFAFNMIPAFPMDGGRILRSLLAMVISYPAATRIATALGQLIGLALAAIGLVGMPLYGVRPNLGLVIIGFMVFGGALQENRYVQRKAALSSIAVGQVANHHNGALSPSDRVTAVMFARQAVLPVVVGSKLIGLVTPRELQNISQLARVPTTVAQVMRTDFPVLAVSETLWSALEVLRANRLEAVPVVQDGKLHGMVTLNDIHRAWRRTGRPRSS